MTTILPITPRTPSSLLAALALSPVLAPLNSEATLSLSSFHLPHTHSTPHLALPSAPSSPFLMASTAPPPIIISPPRTSRSISHTHRVIGLNEAHQLTLLIIQHFYPVRASSKGMMKASIELAEQLHQSGIRWDRHRRVMGMHLRGIWEEGARLVGGIDRIGDLSLEEQGVFDLYVRGSFLSVAEETHPLAPAPLAIPTENAGLPTICITGEQTGDTLEHTEPAHTHQHGPSNRSGLVDTAVKDPIIWRKRMNNALKVHIDRSVFATYKMEDMLMVRKRMAAAQATQPMSALSALSMMSVTELRWALFKRMRYRFSRAVGKAPRNARQMHFGGWEMR